MSPSNNTASSNPGNFANRPSEEVKVIASLGGKASHGTNKTEEHETPAGRNVDGTFVKGSEAAKEAGHTGGLRASGQHDVSELEVQNDTQDGRNADGTFNKGSEAAKDAGHKGGVAAAEN